MKCTKCGAEWKSSVDTSISKCPFWQTPLLEVPTACTPEKPEEVLKYIIDQFGVDVLKDTRRLNSLLSDLLFDKRKKMIANMINNGLSREIYALLSVDELDRNMRLKNLQVTFVEEYGYGESQVQFMVDCLIYALGWITELEDTSQEKLGGTEQTLATRIEQSPEYPELVCQGGFYGYRYKDGKMLTSFMYERAGIFNEGFACVRSNGKYGFIDINGCEVIPFKYNDAWSFGEGLAPVKLIGKYGFIDKSDREVIPFKYDFAEKFSEGVAPVKLNGKHGFIDRHGNKVI